MIRTILGGVAFVILSTSALYAAGSCSTGHYNTCVSCCQNNPNIHINKRDICVSQCGSYPDSPLGRALREKGFKRNN